MRISNFSNVKFKYRIDFKSLILTYPFAVWTAFPCLSQPSKNLTASLDFKKLSVEELMNIEAISVSKTPKKLTEVASAISVQNLLKERHVEVAGVQIPRSIYGRITWRH